jgi:hypothetical protein
MHAIASIDKTKHWDIDFPPTESVSSIQNIWYTNYEVINKAERFHTAQHYTQVACSDINIQKITLENNPSSIHFFSRVLKPS